MITRNEPRSDLDFIALKLVVRDAQTRCLWCSGPYKVNGVPLRRVNQAYVIATSTKVELGNLDVGSLSDDFFKRAAKEKSKKDANEFFKEDKKVGDIALSLCLCSYFSVVQTNAISEARKAQQKRVDSAVLPKVNAVQHLKHYLGAKFSLTDNLLPHAMKF